MNKKTIRDVELTGKRVLVRVDFNVPQDDAGNVTDDSRIRSAIPTVRHLLEHGAKKVIICSHLGRPKGKVKMEYTMKPVCDRFRELLGQDVFFVPAPELRAIRSLPEGRVLCLENLRFDPGEEAGDPEFAKALAKHADAYVFDAFGAAHRAHASVSEIPKLLPTCAGKVMEKETSSLSKVLEDPERPFIGIIGGAKADKIDVIRNLLPKVDRLIISGILANTLLKAKGYDIGKSKFDQETLDLAQGILELGGDKIVLPVDAVLADRWAEDADTAVKDVTGISGEWMVLDIGPKTEVLYKNLLKGSRTVVWGGPIGVFEWERFAHGTRAIAEYIASLGNNSVICGGDSGAAVIKFGLEHRMFHVSTGGGASLEYLGGSMLPGIMAVSR